MRRRLVKPLIILLAAVLCLPSAAVAVAQEQPIMLSQVLKAPLRGELRRPIVGDPQPVIASVENVLVADDGRIDVIVSPEGDGPGRVIPWSELAYDAVRNDFTLRADGDDLSRFQSWHEPEGDTRGTAAKLLGSKLLDGLVKTPMGESLGEVKDAKIGRGGAIQQVFYDRRGRTASLPWKGIQIRPERPDISAAPGTEAVIVVDRKKL